jgi:hypothetical protein
MMIDEEVLLSYLLSPFIIHHCFFESGFGVMENAAALVDYTVNNLPGVLLTSLDYTIIIVL